MFDEIQQFDRDLNAHIILVIQNSKGAIVFHHFPHFTQNFVFRSYMIVHFLVQFSSSRMRCPKVVDQGLGYTKIESKILNA